MMVKAALSQYWAETDCFTTRQTGGRRLLI